MSYDKLLSSFAFSRNSRPYMTAIKRSVTQRETEKAERATLVRQERLTLSHGRVHRLVGRGLHSSTSQLSVSRV
jgi:hypothetical protein